MKQEQLAPASAGSSPWQFTDPDAAFIEAAQTKKPVFMYWGAVWCPPCNDLKHRVFSHPRFADVVKNFVTVYLDGDTEEAQTFGDRLKVTTYPAMLLLDESGLELARIVDYVSINELQTILQSAALGQKSPQDRTKAILSGKGSDDDFRVLAYSETDSEEKKDATFYYRLSDLAPAQLEVEKALLWLKGLDAAMAKEKMLMDEKSATEISTRLKHILHRKDLTMAAREFFSLRAGDVRKWLGAKRFDEKLKSLWLHVANGFRGNSTLSASARIWAYLPEIELQEKSPKDTAQTNEKEILALLAKAKTRYEKHTATSAAATLFAKMDNLMLAEKILSQAIADDKNDSPWYDQATLAQLFESKGKIKEALTWSARARIEAKGRATVVQWAVMDLLLRIRHHRPHAEIARLLADLYEEIFALNDGFSGRNRVYLQRLAKGIVDNRYSYGTVFETFRPRCDRLADTSRQSCVAHFKALN